MTEKEKKKHEQSEIDRMRKDLIQAQKEIAKIKMVLKDAHLMSLDD